MSFHDMKLNNYRKKTVEEFWTFPVKRYSNTSFWLALGANSNPVWKIYIIHKKYFLWTAWLIDLDICHFQVIFVGFTKSVAIIISVLLQRWEVWRHKKSNLWNYGIG